MDMKEFLERYAANTLEAFKNHSFRVDSFSWVCELCPLKAECEKDSEENFSGCLTCGEFITRNLTDGSEYKA